MMNNAFEASTVEMDHSNFSDLQNQILKNNGAKNEPDRDIRERQEVKETPTSNSKKYVFRKGDQTFEIDDDYELEFMADKKLSKLSLRELKDRAAGDIAVKNRMHSLSEEKKRVQSTFKQFADLAKKDPLAALEFISNKAKESDTEFEYSKYIEKLAEQAEKLGQMDDKERKAWELEKKLAKAEQDLSHKERQEAVVLRKQEILSQYPEIGDSQFGEMVDAVLNNEDLLEGLENEADVMDRVEELIQETLTQRDILTIINQINPEHNTNNELVFSLSDQLRQNPDLDEEDVRDIIRELIGYADMEVRRTVSTPVNSERERDIRTLSSKARQSGEGSRLRQKSTEPFDLLKQQLIDHQKELRKTPLHKR